MSGRGGGPLPLRACAHGGEGGWMARSGDPDRPVLLTRTAGTATFPLVVPAGTGLRGRVRLADHEWRDGRAPVVARVIARAADGTAAQTAVRLRPLALAGRRAGRPLHLRLPGPGPLTLELTATAGGSAERFVLWEDLRLVPAGGVDVDPARAAAAATPADGAAAHAGVITDGSAPSATAEDVGLVVSVVVPVCDPDPDLLRTTLASVSDQSHDRWQLVLIDDASTDPAVHAILDEVAGAHPGRVVVERLAERSGIATATNRGIAASGGELVALLDHDDLLLEGALRDVAAAAAAAPDAALVYTNDEVRFGARVAGRSEKPGFSIEMLRELMYTGHLCAYRRTALEAVGGLRSGFDGSQDYDLVLRVVEDGARVVHVPRVHYAWRAHEASMAGNPNSKPLAYPRARAAVAEHLERTGVGGRAVYARAPGHYRHLPADDGSGARAVVLAVTAATGARPDAIRATLDAIADQRGPTWRCVLVAAAEAAAVAHAVASDPTGLEVAVVEGPTGADGGALLATALRAPVADVLLLLRAPAVLLGAGALATLAAHARVPGVAMVGPRILGADGAVESAGLAVRDGLPWRLLAGGAGGDQGVAGVARFVRAVSGLDDVVCTTATALARVGGLDASVGELTLADACLRAGAGGDRTVLHGEVIVGRPAGQGPPPVGVEALARLREQWADRPDDGLTPAAALEAPSGAGPLPAHTRP